MGGATFPNSVILRASLLGASLRRRLASPWRRRTQWRRGRPLAGAPPTRPRAPPPPPTPAGCSRSYHLGARSGPRPG
eukprot:506704-Pyramimonas_sp.AAC.2